MSVARSYESPVDVAREIERWRAILGRPCEWRGTSAILGPRQAVWFFATEIELTADLAERLVAMDAPGINIRAQWGKTPRGGATGRCKVTGVDRTMNKFRAEFRCAAGAKPRATRWIRFEEVVCANATVRYHAHF